MDSLSPIAIRLSSSVRGHHDTSPEDFLRIHTETSAVDHTRLMSSSVAAANFAAVVAETS